MRTRTSIDADICLHRIPISKLHLCRRSTLPNYFIASALRTKIEPTSSPFNVLHESPTALGSDGLRNDAQGHGSQDFGAAMSFMSYTYAILQHLWTFQKNDALKQHTTIIGCQALYG
jgi:hypothetical protein